MPLAKLPERLRLKDNHPTMKKLDKLFAYAEELGISISFNHLSTVIEDSERDPKLPKLFIEDNEDGTPLGDFPPGLEYKVVCDNPAYLKQKEEEQKEFLRQRIEEDSKKKAEAAARAAREKAALAKRIEQDERKQLAYLQAKYANK